MSSTIGVQNIAHTNGTVAATVSSGGVVTFNNLPVNAGQVINTYIKSINTGVNAGNRYRNPYHWAALDFNHPITSANNYFLWELSTFTMHQNHAAGSLEASEDNSTWVNASNKSDLTGTAVVQSGQGINWTPTGGGGVHLYSYPHIRFNNSPNENYSAAGSASGIYKPTGSPTRLYWRSKFWSENGTQELSIGGNPTGGATHAIMALSSIKVIEVVGQ